MTNTSSLSFAITLMATDAVTASKATNAKIQRVPHNTYHTFVWVLHHYLCKAEAINNTQNASCFAGTLLGIACLCSFCMSHLFFLLLFKHTTRRLSHSLSILSILFIIFFFLAVCMHVCVCVWNINTQHILKRLNILCHPYLYSWRKWVRCWAYIITRSTMFRFGFMHVIKVQAVAKVSFVHTRAHITFGNGLHNVRSFR